MVLRAEWRAAFIAQAGGQGWVIDNDEVFPRDGEIEGEFFPYLPNVYAALGQISPANVRYLILGQDPYFSAITVDGERVPVATGVAFDMDSRCFSAQDSRLQPSLHKIIINLGAQAYEGNDAVNIYRQWVARNQILMLNSNLTVRPNEANSHKQLWDEFLIQVIKQVRCRAPNAKYVAWGMRAKRILRKALKGDKEARVTSAWHPQAHDNGAAFKAFWTAGVGLELKQLML